ncbi:MAG: diaminopimelate epimerase [Opitutales bacterium]
MKFTKYHALGNDYLVLDPADAPTLPEVDALVRICHRNFGLGSDGILYGPLEPKAGGLCGLRILNPDGSEAEKSGNGLRIFARYLFDTGRVSDQAFAVETPGGTVSIEVRAAARAIEVEMGCLSFDSAVIPVSGPAREVINETFEIEGESLPFCAATIGNPHAVFPMETISEAEARRIGPVVETDARFPNRTNVQLLQVLDRQNIRIEIWERGAGYTLASGSSSSAAAAVAHKLGLVDDRLTVHMPGGQLTIGIDPETYAITMTGPATRVGTMDFDPEALGFSV